MKSLKYLLIAVVAFVPFVLTSCSDDSEKIAQIVESRSSQDLMNDLYLACDGDVEALARMLQCTPSSIESIRKAETVPTPVFEKKIKKVVTYYFKNGRKFSKLRSALDPEYGWYDSVLNFPSHHTVWFVIIIIAIILLSFEADSVGPVLIGIAIFIIAWIASLICSPSSMEDKYKDSINPEIEQEI